MWQTKAIDSLVRNNVLYGPSGECNITATIAYSAWANFPKWPGYTGNWSRPLRMRAFSVWHESLYDLPRANNKILLVNKRKLNPSNSGTNYLDGKWLSGWIIFSLWRWSPLSPQRQQSMKESTHSDEQFHEGKLRTQRRFLNENSFTKCYQPWDRHECKTRWIGLFAAC